jgi:hypothetical protein
VSAGQANDLDGILAKANYFYWLHNLPKSTPLYDRAEELATKANDPRDALYAKIGLMRFRDAIPFTQLTTFIEGQLRTPLVQHDSALYPRHHLLRLQTVSALHY